MIPLDEQRRRLLARCEQHRREMAGELANLRTAAVWVEQGYSLVRMLRSIWPLAATVAGVFVARKGGSFVRKAGKIWSLWRLGRRMFGLWRHRAAESSGAEEPAPPASSGPPF
jgi:hypothetical protein